MLLIISFLPIFNNISIFTQPINYSLNNDLNNIKATTDNFPYIDLEKIQQFLQSDSFNNIIKYLIKFFESEEDCKFIYNITNDLKKHSEYLEPLVQIINKNNTILNYFLKIINIIFNETYKNQIFNKIIKILNDLVIYHEELFDFLYNLIEKYPDLFCFLRILKKNFNNTNLDVENLISFFKNNSKLVFDFVKKLLKNYQIEREPIFALSILFKKNKELSIKILKLLRNNTILFNFLIPFIGNDDLISEIIISFFKNNTLIENLLDIFINNNTLFQNFADLLGSENKNKLYFKLPKFIVANPDLFSITVYIIENYMKKHSKDKKTIDFMGIFLREFINIYVNENIDDIKNIFSEECIALLNYTILGYVSDKNYSSKFGKDYCDKNISYYYLYKFIIDTTKNINDLLTYENCLDETHSLKNLTDNRKTYIDNIPTFIISIINLNKNNNIKSNFTFLDKCTFIFGACFPQGINTANNRYILKNGTESYYHCKIEDYKNIINKLIRGSFINFGNITHELIEVNSINIKSDFLWKNLIPFFILIIPIFIYFFLVIYENISIKKRENVVMVHKNKEIIKEEDDDDDNDNLLNNNRT